MVSKLPVAAKPTPTSFFRPILVGLTARSAALESGFLLGGELGRVAKSIFCGGKIILNCLTVFCFWL